MLWLGPQSTLCSQVSNHKWGGRKGRGMAALLQLSVCSPPVHSEWILLN